MKVPTIPNLPYFVTMVPDVVDPHNSPGNNLATAKQIAREDRAKIEEEVNGDELM